MPAGAGLRSTLFRYGWDTRCRNAVPARMLRPILNAIPVNGAPVLLDVGSGGLGVASFLNGVVSVGVDRDQPVAVGNKSVFHRGDITALPYLDRAFPIVSCIDVLEHLPLGARANAIRELVRVASHAVLIACPHGEIAKECDEAFRRACESHARTIPDWLVEHQSQSYPTTSQVVRDVSAAAVESGRVARTSLSYCEPARFCTMVRAAAARSNVLYIALNLALGALFGMLPSPGVDNSYRMIALAEFTQE
jgi:hypothetical protein